MTYQKTSQKESKENLSKTDSQSALADMINHFLTEQADRLDGFRGTPSFILRLE